MRQIMRLSAFKDCTDDMKHHAKIQDFFYNLLKDMGFASPLYIHISKMSLKKEA
ncbi:MAG: hypothetical protein ABIG84_07635 [archaeon]